MRKWRGFSVERLTTYITHPGSASELQYADISRRAAATSSSFPSLAKCCAIKTIIRSPSPTPSAARALPELPEDFTAQFLVERVQLLVGVVMDGQRTAALFRRAKPNPCSESPLQSVDERLAQHRIPVTLRYGLCSRSLTWWGLARRPAPHQV